MIGVGPEPGMHDAQIPIGLPELARLPCVALPGLSVSREGFFQDRVIQRKIGNQLLQSGVLSFKFLEPTYLGGSHSAIFSSPSTLGLFTDAKGLTGVSDSPSLTQKHFGFTELADICAGAYLFVEFDSYPIFDPTFTNGSVLGVRLAHMFKNNILYVNYHKMTIYFLILICPHSF